MLGNVRASQYPLAQKLGLQAVFIELSTEEKGACTQALMGQAGLSKTAGSPNSFHLIIKRTGR